MGAGRGQRVRLHRHTGDERGDVIGRAAEHAEGGVGDFPMSEHAALQVVARARAQKIDGMAAAVFLVGQRVAVRRIRLHIVDAGNRRGGVAEGRMARDVVDLLAADIDGATVAQRLQMFLTGPQHHPLLIVLRTLACRIARNSVHRPQRNDVKPRRLLPSWRMAGCRRHHPRPHQAHDGRASRGALFGLNGAAATDIYGGNSRARAGSDDRSRASHPRASELMPASRGTAGHRPGSAPRRAA